MNCPHYLLVGTFRHYGATGNVVTEAIEINTETQKALDINDRDGLRAYFCEVNQIHPKILFSLLVIANDTVGGPKIIQHWA